MKQKFSRRDFLKLSGTTSLGLILSACGLTSKTTEITAPPDTPTLTTTPKPMATATLAQTTSTPTPMVFQEWSNAKAHWFMDPNKGIKNFTTWEEGYPNDPFPRLLEIRADPSAMWDHAVLWTHINGDLAIEDWEKLRPELRASNVVLNDWIVLAEDSRDPEKLDAFFEVYKGDLVDFGDLAATIESLKETVSYKRLRIYPSPMKDFQQPLKLPVRIEMEFLLGDDFLRKDGEAVVFGWSSWFNILSVFDDFYYPIGLINLEGPLDGFLLQALSSGDPRPGKGIQDKDTFLELTAEGSSRVFQPGKKYGIIAEFAPDQGFLVYVRDPTYDPNYVTYAYGKYSTAAHPQVVSTHTGLYHGWEKPGDKLVGGTFILGEYKVTSLG